MKTCYVLIGVPGSGKTTWTSKQNLDAIVISTDNYIDDYAKSVGKTYSEVFNEKIKEATSYMINDIHKAKAQGKNIIWDQTSVNVASRKKKFKMLPDYKMIAVVFPTPNREELSKRLSSRPGKHIPSFVMETMINSFEFPTLDEGFSEIIVV